jgi:hypothetical protein
MGIRVNRLVRLNLLLTLLFVGVVFCSAQKASPPTKATSIPSPTPSVNELQPIRSSPAYAELLLRRTELESNLDALLVDYTEEFPKVKDIRLELVFLKTEMDRLMAVKPGDAGKLSQALGQLMLRKVEIETQLDALRAQYKDDHPDVRKARKKVETYEAAIKEILG